MDSGQKRTNFLTVNWRRQCRRKWRQIWLSSGGTWESVEQAKWAGGWPCAASGQVLPVLAGWLDSCLAGWLPTPSLMTRRNWARWQSREFFKNIISFLALDIYLYIFDSFVLNMLNRTGILCGFMLIFVDIWREKRAYTVNVIDIIGAIGDWARQRNDGQTAVWGGLPT